MGSCSSIEVDPDRSPNRIHKNQIPHPPNRNTDISYPQQGPATGGWPKIIQGPSLPFIVHIHSHVLASPPIGNIPCWTFISQGLSEVNEPEIVFTVRRRSNENEEAYPSAPIEWIRAIYGVAKAGLHIETGQMCDLVFDKDTVQIRFNTFALLQDPRIWESFRRFGSLIHGIKLQDCVFQFPDGTIPQNARHVIALTQEETAVAQRFGPTRVIGHVGYAVRWFPYPPWVDRDRGDAVTMADQAGSIRVGLPVAQMYGFNASIVGQEIIFTIPADEEKRKHFKKYVTEQPLEAALCFESFMVPEADAGMLWKSGQTEPMAYARYFLNGSPEHTNLANIMFVPQQDKDDCIMVEDGYGILIRDNTWKAIRDAMENGRDIVINLEHGMRFRLEWAKTVYHNPIDGTEQHARWETYKPANPRTTPDSHAQLKEIILLVQPPQGHMSVADFGEYIKQIEEILRQSIPVQPILLQGVEEKGRQIIMEIEMPKCEGWLKMSAFPAMDGLDASGILRQIAALAQPQTLSQVKVQFVFSLWGYEGEGARFS